MYSLEIAEIPARKTGLLSFVPLRTERLLVREFQLADAAALSGLHRDARATRYAGGTRTKEQSFQSLCRIIDRVRRTGFGAFAIELEEDRKLIGWVGIQEMLDDPRYELLYALTRDQWGKGFAAEASKALLHAAFSLPSQEIREVFALVFPQNIGSIRVLEKLGMRFMEYQFDKLTDRYACLYRLSERDFRSIDLLNEQSQSSSKK